MSNNAESVYIGIGSNLADPMRQVWLALDDLADLPGCRLRAHSRLYRTPPLGPPGQPDYVNAAAVLETELEPLDLLDALQAVESVHGRRRDGERWGPRTLDLDMLLYGTRRMDSERLVLPHAQLHLRAFVLLPLLDVAPPDLLVPGHGSLRALASACDRTGVEPLSDVAVQ